MSAGDVVYTSEVSVELASKAVKSVSLPEETVPVLMGIHAPIAAHYKLPASVFEPHAATLDYVVGATAGCLGGTLGRALGMARIRTNEGRLRLTASSPIVDVNGVLTIQEIKVTAHLRSEASNRAAAEGIIQTFKKDCPVYQSLHRAIDITVDLDFTATDEN